MRNKCFLLLLTVLLAACRYPQHCDEFYDVGYNFEVVSDTLSLQSEMPMHMQIEPVNATRLPLHRNDLVVVAQQEVIPEDSVDSVWIKVARDQFTQGWVHERELLQSVVPDDPISQTIYVFSNSHLAIAAGLFLFVLVLWLLRRMWRRRFRMVHLDDIPSPYPMSLCLTLSSAAVLYSSIQMFVPETWTYFYYHPTLNPFGLPMVLSLFLASLWLMLVLFVAAVEDIFRHLSFTEAMLYILSLIAMLAVLYVVFSVSTLYYIGYLLLFAYAISAIRLYWRRHRARYVCGKCGAGMHERGECPKCKTLND